MWGKHYIPIVVYTFGVLCSVDPAICACPALRRSIHTRKISPYRASVFASFIFGPGLQDLYAFHGPARIFLAITRHRLFYLLSASSPMYVHPIVTNATPREALSKAGNVEACSHLPSNHIASTWPSAAASLNQAAAAPKSRLPPGFRKQTRYLRK